MIDRTHTAEPWEVTTTAPFVIKQAQGDVIIARLTTLDAENARRIVACVNYCAGIPNEDMEAWALMMNKQLEKHSDGK